MKRIFICMLTLAYVGLMGQVKPVKYVGSKKCKVCHNKVEKGAQYKIWESKAHAHSFESLLSDEAKAIASEKGLKTAPDASPECLRCHVTGWGQEGGYRMDIDPANVRVAKVNTDLARIGCEACHGPGNAFKSKKKMIQIRKCEIDGETVGFAKIGETTCTACHNSESPTYKPFDYEARVKEIAHPYPE